MALLDVLEAQPAAILLYRWVPWHELDYTSGRYAGGISRLLECVPSADGRLIVVAHSAGGVVVSYGSSKVVVPPRDRDGPGGPLP